MVTFGRYEIRGTLGDGGAATVYRAWDTVLGRAVALKALHPQLAADPTAAGRFQAEAWALARLRHPAIVTVFDVGRLDGRPFYTMELIDGPTLAEIIPPDHGLDPVWVTDALRQLASAVDYIHAAGLVHRDIKAANVMIDRSGRVMLMDFGVGADDAEVHRPAAAAPRGGTAAPRPGRAGLFSAGPPADIYALGALAYHLLVGHPSAGDAGGASSSLRALRPDLPTGMSAAIEAALAEAPEDRPATSARFMDLFTGRSQTERPPPPLPARPRVAARHYGPAVYALLAVGGVALAALVVLTGMLMSGIRINEAPPVASAPTSPSPAPPSSPSPAAVSRPRRPERDAPAAPAAPAVVADLDVFDAITTVRRGEFKAGDSVVACFGLTPGSADQSLVAVVTPDAAGAPAGPDDVAVVARSEPIPPRDGPACVPVRALDGPLRPNRYRLTILHGLARLDSRTFTALRANKGEPIWSDDFSAADRGVLPATAPAEARANYQIAVEDGEYVLRKVNPTWSGLPYVALPATVANAHLAVDARFAAADQGFFMLACRMGAQGGLLRGYRMLVYPDGGLLRLERVDRGQYVALVDWRVITALRRGRDHNRLELTCEGDRLTATVNGVAVVAHRDAAYSDGEWWLGASSFSDQASTQEARFDNLVVTQR